jgi:hypothetical protein
MGFLDLLDGDLAQQGFVPARAAWRPPGQAQYKQHCLALALGKTLARLLSSARRRRRRALLSVPPSVEVSLHVPFPPVLPNDIRSGL